MYLPAWTLKMTWRPRS